MFTNNLPVRPDKDGPNLVNQVAAKILAIDVHAIVPNDTRAAQVMLADLERDHAPRQSSQDLRRQQFHDCYNAMLPVLQKARRLGVRPRDAKPPAVPYEVGADALQAMQEYAAQLDIDIAAFEATTPEQRRLNRLEARYTAMAKHANGLVDSIKTLEARIAQLETELMGAAAA